MAPQSRGSLLLCLTFAAPLFNPVNISGQGIGQGSDKRIDGKYKFMPIPFVNYDRSMGFSLGAVPMLMFNPSEKDTISPSSLVGGSQLQGVSGTFISSSTWKKLWGGWIPYQSEASFFMFKLERRIYKKLYGGVRYIFADVITSIESPPMSDSLTLHGVGLNLSLDTRDNPYFPRNGYLTSLKYNTYPEFLGNETISKKIELETNHYFSTRRDIDVVAARFYSGFGLGELAFSQQFIVNGKDIRGYTQGAFRGNYLLALQGEYRWNFHDRWGAVGFPGDQFLVGLDVAAGVDDWGIYFQIGEAF